MNLNLIYKLWNHMIKMSHAPWKGSYDLNEPDDDVIDKLTYDEANQFLKEEIIKNGLITEMQIDEPSINSIDINHFGKSFKVAGLQEPLKIRFTVTIDRYTV